MSIQNILKKPFDLVVYIGRFQPFHMGHYKTVIYALNHLSDQVLVLCGSSFQSRTIKNPWTYEERKIMILESFMQTDRMKLNIQPIEDFFYEEEKWHKQIIDIVNEQYPNVQKIGIVGHDKDLSSYYLYNFPQWTFINVNHFSKINATQLRDILFENPDSVSWIPVPNGVCIFLEHFVKNTPYFKNLVQEKKFLEFYKKPYESLSYPPIFVTADCFVVYKNRVLLVRRKFNPGKDLLALPGGFVEVYETIEASAIRELKEETNINLTENELKHYLVFNSFYDYPDRSLRGRTITHVYVFNLNDYDDEIIIEAGDDAKGLEWVPILEIDMLKSCFFDDHYQIIQDVLKKVNFHQEF